MFFRTVIAYIGCNMRYCHVPSYNMMGGMVGNSFIKLLADPENVLPLAIAITTYSQSFRPSEHSQKIS